MKRYRRAKPGNNAAFDMFAKNRENRLVEALVNHFTWVVKTDPKVSSMTKRGFKIFREFPLNAFSGLAVKAIGAMASAPEYAMNKFVTLCSNADKNFIRNYNKFCRKSGSDSFINPETGVMTTTRLMKFVPQPVRNEPLTFVTCGPNCDKRFEPPTRR